MKKVGRNVYGSGDTIVTKTSHFFQGLTLGAEGGGGLYAVLYGNYAFQRKRYIYISIAHWKFYNACGARSLFAETFLVISILYTLISTRLISILYINWYTIH